MKQKQHPSILSRQLVIMTFLFIFIVGLFGVVTVGLRQQIAESGAQARMMENRLKEIDRSLSKYRGEIAIAMSPASLEGQNRHFAFGLRAPLEVQVVRVNAETQVRFARQRWQQLVTVPEETIGFFMQENH